MTIKIVFLKQATDNLREMEEYYKDFPPAFLKLTKRLIIGLKMLKNYPLIGIIGRINGTRELFLTGTKYFIVYKIKEDNIEILAILHTSRNYTSNKPK